ncbi:MAG: hypothetical protein MZV70_63720 [Desulfobacterales bacterium]|nr:hypothetical protein [Desulfobacterales bacterium]
MRTAHRGGTMQTKSANTVWHHATVTRARREALNGHRTAILGFTGLSGAEVHAGACGGGGAASARVPNVRVRWRQRSSRAVQRSRLLGA